MPNLSLHSSQSPGLLYTVEGLPGTMAVGHFPTKLWPDWNVLHQAGFRHIVCLASTTPEERYHPSMSGLEWLAKCDLCTSANIQQALRTRQLDEPELTTEEAADYNQMTAQFGEYVRLACKILSALWAGEGVMVHCDNGADRTGLLVGMVLVLSGVPSAEALSKVGFMLAQDGSLTKELGEALQSLLFKLELGNLTRLLA